MKLINIRVSERSHRQKRNAVIIPSVWNSKPGKVICSCCLGEEWLEWAWRSFWRWLGCSVCICQKLKSVLKMGMFIYDILVLFLASSGLSCCTRELCWGTQAQWLRHTESRVVACRLSGCGHVGFVDPHMWRLSSLTRDRTLISCIGRGILNHWTTREFHANGHIYCM